MRRPDRSISSIGRTVDMDVLVALNHTVHRVPLWCVRLDEPSPARNDVALFHENFSACMEK